MLKVYSSGPMKSIRSRFRVLYGQTTGDHCLERMAMLVGRYGVGFNGETDESRWSEKDTILITYGDMVQQEALTPLAALREFLDEHVGEAVNTVHLLPFFPYSSDDGFSVMDYRTVMPAMGNWDDIQALGSSRFLMFDLVLNHVSSLSEWFRQYTAGVAPFRHYFLEIPPGTDLSSVVRPRIHPLLTRTQTRHGERWVWTTFSEDQVDLDFANPDVLFEFLDILFLYISMGVRILRLDAIAYLWKQVGTTCIHLPQTHEVVKLLRDVLDMVAPHVVLLTETNVPHEENISYLGEGDEAHMVYQFTLPPLLLHALQTGQSEQLTAWASGLPDLRAGATYLNFTASHDGIGVRPLEGILSNADLQSLLHGVRQRGGHVSTKTNADGSESPYELNITYFDALSDPEQNDEELHIARFVCSQAVSLCLKGIPAVYFNSLIGARNNTGGVEYTGQARTINREKWRREDLDRALSEADSVPSQVLRSLLRLLRIRSRHPAFHPDARQEVLDLGSNVFAVARTALDGRNAVVAIHNFTAGTVDVHIDGRVPHLAPARQWKELVGGRTRGRGNRTLRLEPYEACWLQAP